MSEETPTEAIPVLREAPEPSTVVDGEVTPLVEVTEPETLAGETTPRVAHAPDAPHPGGAHDEVTGVVALARIRLPRTGMEELDTALTDLEFALAHLGGQERRLLVVIAAAFVSLFLPWFQLWNHGPALPTSPLSGLEIAGVSAMLLIVPLAVILLARAASDRMLRGHRSLAVRVLTLVLALRFFFALLGAPAGGVPWRHSFWALIPALITLGLVLGLLGKLPAWPHRAPLPPR